MAIPSSDRFKRTTLQWIIALALLGTLVAWRVLGAGGSLTPALDWTQRITALALAALFLAACWKRVPQRTVEFGCLLVAVAVCAGCMALRMYWPSHGAGLHLQPLYLWIPVIYVFVFTLTDHRTGLWVSLAILALFVALSLPYLARGSATPYGNLTLQLQFVSAVLIAALYFFSSYQYRLGFAQRTVDQLARISNTDELTGLSNRRHMAAVIGDELERCHARSGGFAILLFDVDHFKTINDELGHAAGDDVLMAVAARAARALRATDSCGRWGGDEFLAVLRGADVTLAQAMAESVRRGVEGELAPGQHHVTISCGVTVARAGETLDGLLQRADVALYAAKRAGRNRVEGIFANVA